MNCDCVGCRLIGYLRELDGEERWSRIMEGAITEVALLPIPAMEAKAEAIKIVVRIFYEAIEHLMDTHIPAEIERLSRLADIAVWYEWHTEEWSRGDDPEPIPSRPVVHAP